LKVVLNTSPQILLAKIGRLDLLTQLYSDILIPASVLDELIAKPGGEIKKIQALIRAGDFQVQKAANENIDRIPADLGVGEREAIALAIEKNADLVILDDREGRKIARSRGLSVTGTIGVLVEARERSLIPSIRPELDRLIEAGMWLNEAFYHRILQEFGE
jgi:hypothetical protein